MRGKSRQSRRNSTWGSVLDIDEIGRFNEGEIMSGRKVLSWFYNEKIGQICNCRSNSGGFKGYYHMDILCHRLNRSLNPLAINNID